MKILFLWQRTLPYHAARGKALQKALSGEGTEILLMEVCGSGSVYGEFGFEETPIDIHTCLPGAYEDYPAEVITRRVTEVLQSLKPDLVFGPGPSFPEGMAAVRYRNQSTASLVVMDDSWEGVLGRGRWKIPIRRLLYRSVDAVFVPGPVHVGFHMRLGMPPARIFTGVNAVDDQFFTPADPENRQNEFLFVGRLEAKKGLLALFREYQRYRRDGGAWGLRVVGAGKLEEEVTELARLADDVRFDGSLTGVELRQAYRAAGCLVFPSRRDEWGLVVNEAMCCGAPVIGSTHAGASRTLIRNGVNGFMVDPLTHGRLSEAMRQFSSLTQNERGVFGEMALRDVQCYGLEDFTASVRAVLRIRRRPNHRASIVLSRRWKGRNPQHWKKISTR